MPTVWVTTPSPFSAPLFIGSACQYVKELIKTAFKQPFLTVAALFGGSLLFLFLLIYTAKLK